MISKTKFVATGEKITLVETTLKAIIKSVNENHFSFADTVMIKKDDQTCYARLRRNKNGKFVRA